MIKKYFNTCHNKEHKLYCIACCSFENAYEELNKTSLFNEIEENTEFFKSLKRNEKIKEGIERYCASKNDGCSSVCGNIIYLDKNKKSVGCAIHPKIIGEDMRPCKIITYCNKFYNINENEGSIKKHISDTKGMDWFQYSNHMKKHLTILSLILGYIKSKI